MSPFQRITIDGSTLEGVAIGAWARELVTEHGEAPWTLAIRDTLHELTHGDGDLTAYTSGTTGAPKKIIIPVADLMASAQLTGTAFGLRAGDRALLCLPCTYVAGKLMLVRAFVLGLDLRFIDPTGPVLAKLPDSLPFRFAAMVPLQLHRAILDDRRRVEELFGTVLLGGGPVSNTLIEDLRTLSTEVLLGYGSTETVTHVALRRLNGPEHSDRSFAIGNVRFTVDDRGCLIVHTPHLQVERHVTNDLVVLIDDTHFIWQGRADHVILSGGKKIFPEQLEARTAGLIAYPHYFSAIPDDRLGQAVSLTVEMAHPDHVVTNEILQQLGTVLNKHEIPRSIMITKRIARTSSGKPIRDRS